MHHPHLLSNCTVFFEQAFGRGVTFFEALLDNEAEPNQGAGRAACRAGLRSSIARALPLKPELVRVPPDEVRADASASQSG